MENDLMNELEDFIAGQTPPPPPVTTSKTAKDVLGERLRTQMGGEKRKLEDNSNNDIMSKTQKMDNDLDSVDDLPSALNGGGGGGPQRLLAQALMDKQPRNNGMGPGGPQIKSPSPEFKKEQRNEELTALLNEHPNMMARAKMQNRPQGPPMAGMGPNGGPAPNRIMNNGDMMENGYVNYGMQQQRMSMQQPHQQQRMNNWNNNNMNDHGGMRTPMYPNGGPPVQKMSMRPQGPRGYYNDPNGPPPNAWVQPNDPNKMMMGPGGPVNGGPPPNAAYYNRANCQRGAPAMRGPGGMNNYDYNSGNAGQMYANGPGPNMRGSYGMNSPNSNGDPYVTRFGTPNGVCQQPMYSPNSGPPPDSMSALRMSANFPTDSNAGYGGYNEFGGPAPPSQGPGMNGGGPPGGPGHPNGYSRSRPNFMPPGPQQNGGMMPYQQGPPGPGPVSNGRINLPQNSPALCHNGSMEMPPTSMGFHPQNQQPHFMDSSNNQQQNGFHDFNDFSSNPNNNQNMQNLMNNNNGSGNGMDSEWRSQCMPIRQSLLNKLKEALISQNYPNAVAVAENCEKDTFMTAESLKDYQYKLVQWLASIYDSSNPVGSLLNGGELATPQNVSDVLNTNSSPDSSTNGLGDVTTSSASPKDPPLGDLVDTATPTAKSELADLMLATPKSESCMSPTSPATSCCSSAINSPLSNSNVITTVTAGSGVTPTTTMATPPPTSNSTTASATSNANSSTFQCPPAMPSISSDTEAKTNTSVTATPPRQAGSTTVAVAQQRRISGSGSMTTNSMAMSSIGNNPQSVDSGIGLGSPRSITSASSSTLYSPKIQGTSPSLLPGSDNSPEKATSS